MSEENLEILKKKHIFKFVPLLYFLDMFFGFLRCITVSELQLHNYRFCVSLVLPLIIYMCQANFLYYSYLESSIQVNIQINNSVCSNILFFFSDFTNKSVCKFFSFCHILKCWLGTNSYCILPKADAWENNKLDIFISLEHLQILVRH